MLPALGFVAHQGHQRTDGLHDLPGVTQLGCHRLALEPTPVGSRPAPFTLSAASFFSSEKSGSGCPQPRCSRQDTGRPGLRAWAPLPREEGARALRTVPGPRGSRRREPRLRGPGPFPIPGRTLALWMDTHGRGSDGDSPHHGRSVSDSASVNVLPVKTTRLMSRGERFWPHGQPPGSAHGQCLTSGWGGREGECV